MPRLTKGSEDYVSNRAWFRDVAGGQDVILRNVSALEFLQLFVGYANETKIDVYAKEKGIYDNINYFVVDTFDGIDFVKHGSVLCSTFNQAVNDMLSDFDDADELALVEAVGKYYYANGESFDSLKIRPENRERFDRIKEWAIAE